MYVDAHCHVDLYPSYSEIVKEAELSSTRVIAVTTTPQAYDGNLLRCVGSSNVIVALGLHPQNVGSKFENLETFDKHLGAAKVVGEVGLDASPQYYRTFAKQLKIFEHIVTRTAEIGGRPISVHAVRSVRRALEVISRADPSRRSRYAIHWFSGSISEARSAHDLGCYFSVNVAMFGSDKGLELLKSFSSERVFTETDGPFIEDSNGPLRPPAVRIVVKQLADLWQVTSDEATARVEQNFKRFLGEA